MSDLRVGALLINLGTPESTRTRDVRRYLREFLSDPKVIDLPSPLRWLLLHTLILPFRPRASARAYRKIWTPEGSPLLVNARALRDAVARDLGPGYVVEIGMRYGKPSIAEGMARLAAADVARIVALPLFPQYSEAATGSAVARVFETVEKITSVPPTEVLPPFHAQPGFISASAEIARPRLEAFRPDFVLFSYHGLPERQVRKADPSGSHCLEDPACCDAMTSVNRDCYRSQCFATTRALAGALDLKAGGFTTAFQSRLGRTPWIGPYTDRVLEELADRGVKRLAVMCPAFAADCLETLEEIGMRGRQRWNELGGVDLLLMPSLNAEPPWVSAVADWIRSAA
jgi:ferrochelatase